MTCCSRARQQAFNKAAASDRVNHRSRAPFGWQYDTTDAAVMTFACMVIDRRAKIFKVPPRGAFIPPDAHVLAASLTIDLGQLASARTR